MGSPATSQSDGNPLLTAGIPYPSFDEEITIRQGECCVIWAGECPRQAAADSWSETAVWNRLVPSALKSTVRTNVPS